MSTQHVPAFPLADSCSEYGNTNREACNGMTLRDYMAIHSTQPGITEICKTAGVGYSGGLVYPAADSGGMRFDDWFGSLSLERICELAALVRYAQADAMLKAREAQ